MIDFTGVNAVQIPEGNVTKIARKSDGVVLWEKPATGDLPAGYTRLEYVIFGENQTIDSEIIPDYNTKIEVVFEKIGSTAMYLYGVRSTNNTASVTAYLNNNGAWRFGATYRTFTYSANTKHTVTQSRTGIISNGTSYAYNNTVTEFTAPHTLTIGSARTTSGGYGEPSFAGKIYDFKMYDGDILTAEYIPSLSPGGVAGFWDKVSGTFKRSVTDIDLGFPDDGEVEV